MTKDLKELLFIDLSSRLPYGVIIDHPVMFRSGTSDSVLTELFRSGNVLQCTDEGWDIESIKPYLKSLNRLTDKEKEELRKEHEKDEKLYAECIKKSIEGDNSMRGRVIPHYASDWCNKNHYNYRLPKELYIEAPDGMY